MPSSQKAQHTAAWVLPIAGPPIRHGYVAVDGGEIVDVGALPPGTQAPPVAILPGLVNAHTHLELSWMAGRVPPEPSMGQWIRALMAQRRSAAPPEEVQRDAIVAAIAAAHASGTVAFGDIGNTLLAAEVLAEAGVPAILFYELIGFGPGDARARAAEGVARARDGVRVPVRAGLAPHAPYSVSPDLFRAIRAEVDARALPSSVHLGESREELEFLMSGTGEIAETLRALGAWNDAWSAPGVDPSEYLDDLGMLRPGLLVVHATQLAPNALARLAGRGCVLVTCPRSNRWVGAGVPPIEAFYASGAPVAIGTDSLASVEDLNMFSEMAAVRSIAPAVPARDILRSATLEGARALGFGGELGAIAPGLRAQLIAVRIPAHLDVAADVEEYLVRGGVSPSDISWL
jgi:aminodeoxyfutalosine deaminase